MGVRVCLLTRGSFFFPTGRGKPCKCLFTVRSLLVLSVVAGMVIVMFGAPARAGSSLPAGFVDVLTVIPSVIVDMRYYGDHNFVGGRVSGYHAPRCLLTRRAAEALSKVQGDLLPFGLSLKVYDCYRPQRAVEHFVRWARDVEDTKTRKEFYPTVDKRNLFRDGYIAERSGHSRGSTVDLTIVPLPLPPQETYLPGQPLYECFLDADRRFKDNSIDMGTGFDCFHEYSHTANPKIGAQQRLNRLALKSLMEKHGFVNYEMEWWHYTLRNEPFPDTYFDFPID